jgi:hypothetical protein
VGLAVLGWVLVAIGAATVTFAVAAMFWVYLNFSPLQFDLRPVWVIGSLVVLLGGTLLGGGIWTLSRKA